MNWLGWLILGIALGWATLPILNILKLCLIAVICVVAEKTSNPSLNTLARRLSKGYSVTPTKPPEELKADEILVKVWSFPIEHQNKVQDSLFSGQDFAIRTRVAFLVGSGLGYKEQPGDLVRLNDRELENIKLSFMNLVAEVTNLQISRQGVDELLNSMDEPDAT